VEPKAAAGLPGRVGGREAGRGGRLGPDVSYGSRTDLGKAVQVDPMKPKLKPPEIKRLKIQYYDRLSNFAFKFNLRCYTWGWSRRGGGVSWRRRPASRGSATARAGAAPDRIPGTRQAAATWDPCSRV
jgi:hypothetical protein